MSSAIIAALAALGMIVLCLGALSLSIERLRRLEKQQVRRQRLPCLWFDEDEPERNEKKPAPR